jgi:hypothetical protein
MDEHWKSGAPSARAALLGAGERLRPILMTACAMTVGMVPMALALEKGSEMQAPLGRAVIGGLIMSTFATLLVLPSVFAIVIGRRSFASPSIYPDDRESRFYDPGVFADEDHRPGHEGRHADREPTPHDVVARHTDDEIMGFLRSMLHEIRQKRHEMTTHRTMDDLRRPLGFAKGTAGEGSRAPDDGPDPEDDETSGWPAPDEGH